MIHDQEKLKIINVSQKSLTLTQIDILSKGLKFTPTAQKPNTAEMKDDHSEF